MLTPSQGWGGSYLPKDTRAIIHSAAALGVPLSVTEATVESNRLRAKRIANTVLHELEL